MSDSHNSEPVSSSDTTPPQTFHHWPDLPAEIKLEVLANLLVDPHECWDPVIDAETHRVNLDEILFLSSIGTRNHDLVTLAQDVYYKRNIFKVEIGVDWEIARLREYNESSFYKGTTIPGVCYPKPSIARLIRHLEVKATHAYVRSTLEDMVLGPDTGWRWLLKPTQALHYGPLICQVGAKRECRSSAASPETDTQWQLGFSNLKALTVTLEMVDMIIQYDDWGDCCDMHDEKRVELVGWVE
jgi:hypothetical protein